MKPLFTLRIEISWTNDICGFYVNGYFAHFMAPVDLRYEVAKRLFQTCAQ